MTLYSWQRTWVAAGTILQQDYSGFPHYHLENSQFYSKNAFLLEELKDKKCLVLLGAPGSGKSTVVKQVNICGPDLSHIQPLNTSNTDEGVIKAIKKSQKFKEWREGNYQKVFHLFLDSLDEALLHVPVLYNALREWLRDLKEEAGDGFNNLRFRITCRTAVWDKSFTEELKALFDEKGGDQTNVFLYELAPLSQPQVREAAQTNDTDGDTFVEKIRHSQLVAMAINPITLNMLFEVFAEGELAEDNLSKSKIYRKGCQKLCSENDKEKFRSKAAGKLTSKTRFLIASRLAAYTTFGNQAGISKIGDNQTEQLLHPNQFLTDSFEAEGEQIRINTEEFTEVVEHTSLFCATGEGLGWSHKTYEEFLAAYHLNALCLPIDQLRQLFLSTEHQPYQVIPQLEETAVWLCSMNEEFLSAIIEIQPKLILRIEERSLDDAKKSIVVQTLLRQVSNQEEATGWHDKSFYTKLQHSQLDHQIKPYIEGKDENYLVRRMALEIAEACKVALAKEELWRVLEDKTEITNLRTHAAEALATVCDQHELTRLVPFGTEPQDEDTDDELKGTVLDIVYPKIVTTQTVIECLTDFKTDNLYGIYKAFIYHLGEKIPEDDLKTAVSTFLRNEQILTFIHTNEHDFDPLISSLVTRLWKSVEKDGIVNKLVELLIALAENHHPYPVVQNADIRRKVGWEAIRLIDQDRLWAIRMNPDQNVTLLSFSDWDWLVERLKQESDKAIKTKVSLLLRRIFSYDNLSLSQVEEILSLSETFPEFEEQFKGLINAVDLDSPEAQNNRLFYLENKKHEQRLIKQEKQQSRPSPQREIEKRFENMSKDGLQDWYAILYYCSQSKKDQNKYYESPLEMDIGKWDVWNELPAELQEKVTRTAYLFFNSLKGNTYSASDFGNSRVTYAAMYDCKTLSLILAHDPGFIDQLDTDYFARWGALILWCYLDRYQPPLEAYIQLTTKYYENNRESFTVQLGLLLERMADGKNLIPPKLERLSLFFDSETTGILLKIVDKKEISLEAKYCILSYMIVHQFAQVKGFIAEKTASLYQSSEEDDDLNEICGVLMILHGDLFGWEEVLALLEKGAATSGKILLLAASYAHNREIESAVNGSMSPLQMGKLLAVLYQQFPTSEDPKHEVAYTPSPRDDIADVRNSCLSYLIQHGSVTSVNVLSALSESLPDETDLAWRLIDAKQNMRKNTWVWVKPAVLKELLQNANKRFVNNGNDLMEIVCQSLDRLGKKLHGETPAVQFLWNESKTAKKSTFTHKDENPLSDFVKIHLEQDLKGRGIIAQREVEIKRSTGMRDGERTDIYVSAIVPRTQDIVQIVIETKGCWHDDLDTAMQNQLRDIYLKHHNANYGLYLVGWFYGNHFPVPQKSGVRTIEDMRRNFEQQAFGLSTPIATLRSYVLDCSL